MVQNDPLTSKVEIFQPFPNRVPAYCGRSAGPIAIGARDFHVELAANGRKQPDSPSSFPAGSRASTQASV